MALVSLGTDARFDAAQAAEAVESARALGSRLGGLMPDDTTVEEVVDLAAKMFAIWQATQV